MNFRKKVQRLLAMLLTIALIATVVPMNAAASNTDTTEFAGGSGTAAEPYLIETKEQLDNVRNYLDAHFKLVCDLEFNSDDFAENGNFYNDGAGFEPIGVSSSSVFKGTFDGNGHTIKNLHITISSSENPVYVGVFRYNSGTIKNLGIVDGYVTAPASRTSKNIGTIAGYNNGTIENCYNTGAVSVSYEWVSYISEPSFYMGGIVGKNTGTIANCYNTGAVSADEAVNSYVGSIAGSNTGTIENCYNTGTASAKLAPDCRGAYAGGIVGINSKKITNCYNIGAVWAASDSGGFAGGIVGKNSGTTTNCYFANIVSNGVGSGTDTAIKATAAELKLQDTFEGFDFEHIWTFDENLSFHRTPVLKDVRHIEVPLAENTSEFAGGYGTYYNPYLVSNITHLNNVRNYLDAHFKLICDIDFEEAEFEPIGGSSFSAFTGTFDGNGYVIKNLYSNGQYAGLFGCNRGLIENLGMVNGSISTSYGGCTAGGIAGRNYSTIANCYNTGTVSALAPNQCCAGAGGIAGHNYGTITDSYNIGAVTAVSSEDLCNAYAGGIVGNNNGTIENCYNAGAVLSASPYNAYAGGIVGRNADSTIANCYNTGAVTASAFDDGWVYVYAGGIVGHNADSTITNCYNTGAVSADEGAYSYVGGIVGSNNEWYGRTEVIDCYNVGPVSASAIYAGNALAGGIAGESTSIGKITNCYYLNNISLGVGYGNGKTIKCTAEQLKQESTFEDFDFDIVWDINSNFEYKYPQLITKSKSMTVFSQPENSTYVQGEEPDLTGAILKIEYELANQPAEKIIQITLDMLNEFDNQIIGEQKVYVNYNNLVSTNMLVLNGVEKTIAGTCGDNLTWHLGCASGILTISGSGNMYDYTYLGTNNSPWWSYRDLIKQIYIGEGVTSIGSCAFSECENLTSITIPDSIISIGERAFIACRGLTDITIGNGVNSIGEEAFFDCGLTSLVIPDGVISIGKHAFDTYSGQYDVWYEGGVSDRNNISIEWLENSALFNAIWHYNTCTDEHVYSSACDGMCDKCDWTRDVNAEHTYANVFDNEYHWIECSLCKEKKNTPVIHEYDNACDTTCNVCGNIIIITHQYEWIIDQKETCGVDGIKHEECTICHVTRNEDTKIDATNNHTHDNVCDTTCNVCEQERMVPDHSYTLNGNHTCEFCKYSKTPAKPVIEGKTNNSVTLVRTEGFEYSKDGISWQTSNVFMGLLADTTYTFYQRVKKSTVALVSGTSEGTSVIFKSAQTAPSAPIILSFTDTTVTLVVISNGEYSIDGTNWQASNVFMGLSSGTKYTFYQRYAETDTYEYSNKSTGTSVTTEKAKQTLIPDAPTVESVTSSSITLVAVSGCEYSKNGTTWQTSNVFGGLSCGTEYTLYQRYKETFSTYAGKSSEGMRAKTDKGTQSAPSKPTLSSKTYNSVILVKYSGYEYSMDGINWQTSNVFIGLNPETNYLFYQRKAETDRYYASVSSISLTVKTNEEPKYITGDINNDEAVTDADALYLLYHTIFGDSYPIEQDCDYNNDGSVTDADALYLLYHTIFGDSYPLN